MADKITIHAVGDVSPRRGRAEFLFTHAAPALNQAEIVFCQLETPFSERFIQKGSLRSDSFLAGQKDVKALVNAGFNICSLASNHCLYWGEEAFLDTLDILKENNIRVIGAGRNIAEARQPAALERNGTRTAFLAYNSVVAPGSDALEDKPGCVPMRASTTYEQIDWQPGTPPRIITRANKEDLSAMVDDIRKARACADLVVISIHWGVHYVASSLIAMYQYEVGHAAIDAGADLILGHHPHLLKGIEVYKGKVIFFSLGNFAFDTMDLRHRSKIKALYNVKIDPDYPTYDFPPDSRKSIMVKVIISNKRFERISFLPVIINKQGQPELLHRSDKRRNEVFEYVEWQCRDQGLSTTFSMQEDEAVIVTSEGVAE